MAPALCLSVHVVKVECHVCVVKVGCCIYSLFGSRVQATLHQELSIGMGWKGYGLYRYEEGVIILLHVHGYGYVFECTATTFSL